MPARPNIVIILTDDLGYGDLSCQGHPVIRTPNLDQLAAEGQRWSSFYASSPLCNPSRTALMTGRLPIRIHGNGLNRSGDLPLSELTIADMLKESGYATCYVGKWGLCRSFEDGGVHPNDSGFDYYYGLVGSNDPLPGGVQRTYQTIKNATGNEFPVSLYRQRDVIENRVYQPTLTNRYTAESVNWIKARAACDEPFFLFLGHTMPHVPIFRSLAFEGHSKSGLYGDVIEEIDWSVGQIVSTLESCGVADNTLAFFSSDNGPWLTYYDLGGSPGPWRDGKITSWEGGFRVPGIFWLPKVIQPAVINDIGVNIDLMATIASLTGATLPSDRMLDSIDLSETLLTGAPSPRSEWFFYGQPGNLWAARLNNYKLVFESWESMGREEELGWRGYANHQKHDPPLLFDLTTDISERLDISAEHPEMVAKIHQAIERHQQSLVGTDR